MDQNKKTMRHFYCRDSLWDTFEQMANDFDCSIDYLINESMQYYARSKNYMAQGGPPAGQMPMGGGAPMGGMPGGAPPMGGMPGGAPPMGGGMPGRRPPPPPSGGFAARRTGQQQPAFPPPMPNRPPTGAMPPSPMNPPAMGQPPGMGQPMSPPAMGGDPMAGAGSGTLFLIFNNQRIPVDKDQFIIGRGSKTSDLAIKDGNISRKHSAIIRRNGTYYIKDLGSTNGIDYKGMRIDNKRIDEGDVFHLCDYELRFTYRG